MKKVLLLQRRRKYYEKNCKKWPGINCWGRCVRIWKRFSFSE